MIAVDRCTTSSQESLAVKNDAPPEILHNLTFRERAQLNEIHLKLSQLHLPEAPPDARTLYERHCQREANKSNESSQKSTDSSQQEDVSALGAANGSNSLASQASHMTPWDSLNAQEREPFEI